MDVLRTLLEQQPLAALFLTIALGSVAGQINIGGFSLGVGAVLFVALGMGWFAPKAVPAPMLGTFGLALFLYTVGIQYGKDFVAGLTSINGLRVNLLALSGLATAALLTILLIRPYGLNPGYALGLFAGSATSTPSLQVAITGLGNDDPAVGYSIAYPFGVAGPILFLYLAFLIFKPKIEPPPSSNMEMLEVALKRPDAFGRRLGELMTSLPANVQITALRRDHRNQHATPDIVLREDDVLLLIAPGRELLEEARRILGEAAPGRFTKDRGDLDYLRVFASRPALVGQTIGGLDWPGGNTATVMHVRRGDADLLPQPDLVLEYGDRLGLLARRNDFPALRQYFGDSIKGTAEFSYVSIGLGMALGFFIGLIPIPVPGVGTISLGLSSVLILALILGSRRRTAGLNWTIPLSANLVMRNLGLTVFLAQVGIASGPKFVATVADTGFQMLGLGAVILAGFVLPVLMLGLYAMRMPFDEVAGVVVGVTGNPAILAYANRIAPTNRPDLAYATTYPGMTVLKILFVSIVPAFL